MSDVGHGVIERTNSAVQGGLYRSYVDYNIPLPVSRLVSISVYIHQDTRESVPCRLQVWLPQTPAQTPAQVRFKLIYQHRVQLPTVKGLFTVRRPSAF